MLQNDNLIRALLRQPVDRTPIWMMRQAGRYLPEYRQLRKQVPDFMTFCRTPALCCEATLQPLARFDLDAAIIFSDILTVPAAMGLPLQFVAGSGPQFSEPLRSRADLARLKAVDASALDYVMQAITLTRRELAGRVPLFGFAGSPWTVACYMVEGAGSKIWPAVRAMLYSSPQLMHELLDKITVTTIAYLNAQIEAGADAIMLFDTWGSVLAFDRYPEFSLQYMQRIAAAIHREHEGRRIPLVLFTKQASPWLELLADSDCDGIGLDSTVNLSQAIARVGDRVTLQGNLDPFTLYADADTIRQSVHAILDAFAGHDGHVFNLGHGIDKDTPIAGVEAMVAAVREYDARARSKEG